MKSALILILFFSVSNAEAFIGEKLIREKLAQHFAGIENETLLKELKLQPISCELVRETPSPKSVLVDQGVIRCVVEQIIRSVLHPEETYYIDSHLGILRSSDKHVDTVRIRWNTIRRPAFMSLPSFFLTGGLSLSLFLSELPYVFDHLWNMDIAIDSLTEPLPLDWILPFGFGHAQPTAFGETLHSLNSNRYSITRIQAGINTFLPNETVRGNCEKLRPLDFGLKRMCANFNVFGLDTSSPAVFGDVLFGWTDSSEIKAKMVEFRKYVDQINLRSPDGKIWYSDNQIHDIVLRNYNLKQNMVLSGEIHTADGKVYKF